MGMVMKQQNHRGSPGCVRCMVPIHLSTADARVTFKGSKPSKAVTLDDGASPQHHMGLGLARLWRFARSCCVLGVSWCSTGFRAAALIVARNFLYGDIVPDAAEEAAAGPTTLVIIAFPLVVQRTKRRRALAVIELREAAQRERRRFLARSSSRESLSHLGRFWQQRACFVFRT